MTAVSPTPVYPQPARAADGPDGPPLTLADEHLLLLWQVTARAAELQSAAARGQWPGAELASLAGFARAEVLRQAAQEEALLFPASPSPAIARLARDHLRLRAAAELLTRAASGEQLLSPGQLAVAARDFADQLEYHMSAEEKLLTSKGTSAGAPSTARLEGDPH